MPKEKDHICCIPKIYKKSFENIGLFFSVESQKKIVPTITDFQAIRNYYEIIGVSDFDCNSELVTLSRMRAEFIDLKYSNHVKDTEKTGL